MFALNVCRYVKSNAIVLTSNTRTVGIGSGQPSRLDSCKIAIDKMKNFQKIKENDQVVAASDAFFPFVDGIETLVQANAGDERKLKAIVAARTHLKHRDYKLEEGDMKMDTQR